MPSKSLTTLVLLALFAAASLAHPTQQQQQQQAKDNEDNEKSNDEDELTFDKNTKIAILGGGPAGLFAARQLKRGGYRKVTVFEASTSGSRAVNTATVDGHVVDFTTRYLPNANPNGQGLYPPLQTMIDEYGLATQFVSAPITYVAAANSQVFSLSGPHIYADLMVNPGPAGIVADLIWGFDKLKTVYDAAGVTGCYTALNVAPGTSFAAWAAAVNKPGFTRLAAFTGDAFLGGPSGTQDVCTMLKVRAHFMPGDIAGVLRSFGVSNTSPLPLSASLRSLLDPTFSPDRKLFTLGYKTFFDKMVDIEGLNVELGAKVMSVKLKDNGKVKITLENGDSQTFDKVIIASKPSQALQFLEDDLAIKPLLSGVQSAPIHVHAYRTTKGTNAYTPNGADHFSAILYPAGGLLASATMPQTAFAVNKEYDDSSLVIAIGYANNDGSTADEAARAQSAIASLGYTPTDSVFAAVFPYPAIVPATTAASGWFGNVDALQGTANLYYIGEAFSGYGVPSVLEETTRVISGHFFE